MAFTVTERKKTVYGDLRVQILNVGCDAAAGEVETMMDYIEGVSVEAQTATGNGAYAKVNVLSGGTASPGYLAIKSAANGSDLIVTVYGR